MHTQWRVLLSAAAGVERGPYINMYVYVVTFVEMLLTLI